MSAATDAIWPPDRASPPYDEDDDEIRHAFMALTLDEARALADRATEVLETTPSEREFDEAWHARLAARELLVRLVCHVPGSLDGVHTRLLDVDVMGALQWSGYAEILFHDAGPDVRDRLLAMDNRYARLALAWMADPSARVALAEQGPEKAFWSALAAGWAFGEEWASPLHHQSCYRLQRGRALSPVAAVVASDERCGGCGDPMTVLLDIDLSDDRVDFEADGRLCITTCERCVAWGTVFATVDTDGGGQWSDHSVRPTSIHDMPSHEPREPLGLGDERPRPFSGLAFDTQGTSQLGGVPVWVQNPDYPTCPACGGLMPYVGQVNMADTGEEWGQGTIYAFWSRGCGLAATVYQQT